MDGKYRIHMIDAILDLVNGLNGWHSVPQFVYSINHHIQMTKGVPQSP